MTNANLCLGDHHLFEIRVGMGDSCLCGATMMNEGGKVVPRVSELEQLMTEVWDANAPKETT